MTSMTSMTPSPSGTPDKAEAVVIANLRSTQKGLVEIHSRIGAAAERLRITIDTIRGSVDSPPAAEVAPESDSMIDQVAHVLSGISVQLDTLDSEIDRL